MLMISHQVVQSGQCVHVALYGEWINSAAVLFVVPLHWRVGFTGLLP